MLTTKYPTSYHSTSYSDFHCQHPSATSHAAPAFSAVPHKRPPLRLFTEHPGLHNASDTHTCGARAPCFACSGGRGPADANAACTSCPLPTPPSTADTFFHASAASVAAPSSPVTLYGQHMPRARRSALATIADAGDAEPRVGGGDDFGSNDAEMAHTPPPTHTHFSSAAAISSPCFSPVHVTQMQLASLRLNPPRTPAPHDDPPRAPSLPSFASLDIPAFAPSAAASASPSRGPAAPASPMHNTSPSPTEPPLVSPPVCPRRPLSMIQIPTVPATPAPPRPPVLSRSMSTSVAYPPHPHLHPHAPAPHPQHGGHAHTPGRGPPPFAGSSPLSTLLHAAKEVAGCVLGGAPLRPTPTPPYTPPLTRSLSRDDAAQFAQITASGAAPESAHLRAHPCVATASPTATAAVSAEGHASTGHHPHSTVHHPLANTAPVDTSMVSMVSTKRIKEFPCPDCGKLFSRAYNLKSHMKTHTSERPFKCDHCNKAFARKQDCLRHMRIHTNDRPFVCHRCGTSFSRQDALSRHEYTCFASRAAHGNSSPSSNALHSNAFPSLSNQHSDYYPPEKSGFHLNSTPFNDSGIYLS